jgi:AcrR family transcriptional regulator
MVSQLRLQRDAQRRERTRVAILDAAGRVFAHKGYHGTLISDIVGDIGAGQGTFYRHFTNKREVVDALFERFVESLLAEFAPMSLELPGSVEEYSQASFGAVIRLVRVVQSQRDLAVVFLHQGRSIDAEFEHRLSEVFDRFVAVAQFHLQRAIDGGFARPCDAETIAQAVVGMALRQLDLWLAGRIDDRETERIAHELVEFAFWGFGPRDGAAGSKP